MKPRTEKGEKIGGGFFVHRRGKTSRRIHAAAFPFEHGTMMAAISECERLAKANPGETYVVVGQCYEAFVEREAVEELAAGPV